MALHKRLHRSSYVSMEQENMTMTTVIEHATTRKILRGRAYGLAEFMRKYRLDEHEATRLYEKFGPSATELDLLMAAKRRQPVLHETIDA